MNELALFAGAGGGILGGYLLGWRTVCAVEINPYAQAVLIARQRDGILPEFPIWDDVTTFDGKPWSGLVDIVSGGFPCQDISVAGSGAGIDGERSGLWREFARIIREVRPNYVLVENSPALTGRGLGTVLGDLAAMGYDAEWGVLSASDLGAPHRRERIWIVAHHNSLRELQPQGGISDIWGRIGNGSEKSRIDSDSDSSQRQREGVSVGVQPEDADTCDSRWWTIEPGVDRMAYGVANGVDRLKAIGNGQVPVVAAAAFRRLARF